MDFPTATFKVSRGLTYAYIHVPPPSSSKPYVLFLHGFPSVPTDHHNQIIHLSNLGYGIIAPQLLGYGETSHPTESDAYRLKLIAKDLIEVLDHHAITQVLGVGHDWGVTMLTRLEFYYPDRIKKMALLAIACAPFGQPFDLDTVNSMTKEHLGYEGFGYQTFFTRDADAGKILNAHQDSFRSIMFATDHDLWKQHFGAIGGLKQWLDEDRRTDTIAGYSEVMRKEHELAFSVDNGGYNNTLNWYKNHVLNTNTSDEQAELESQGVKSYQTQKPVLQILAAKDVIALAPMHKQMAEAYAPHGKIESVGAGHWVMLEAPETVNRELEQFFEET